MKQQLRLALLIGGSITAVLGTGVLPVIFYLFFFPLEATLVWMIARDMFGGDSDNSD